MTKGAQKSGQSPGGVGDPLFTTVLDACDFGMIVIGANHRIRFWNQWMSRYSGKSAEEVLNHPLEVVFPDIVKTRIPAAIDTALKDGMPSVLSPRLNHRPFPLSFQGVGSRAGEELDQSITVKPIVNDEDPGNCLVQIVDMTPVTKREKMLRKMANDTKRHRDELVALNRDKDRFFSIIAHDLKGPFNALLSMSKLLSSGSEKIGPKKVTQYSAAMHFSAKELFKLLENLLDWSLIQMGRMQYTPTSLSPAALVRDCINLMAPTAVSKGIRLELNDGGCPDIQADERMTATILRNIIGNAVKFTPSGGDVEIIITQSDDRAIFAISDTGAGLSSARIKRLLNTDSGETSEGTAGETGSGLGLHLCKELIRTQGGDLSITSEEGKGTTFSFTLPLAPKAEL